MKVYIHLAFVCDDILEELFADRNLNLDANMYDDSNSESVVRSDNSNGENVSVSRRKDHLMHDEVFMAVKIRVGVFWVVMPHRVLVGYQRFGGPCCLHIQGEVEMEVARSSKMLVS
jgi:hypothetical protein